MDRTWKGDSINPCVHQARGDVSQHFNNTKSFTFYLKEMWQNNWTCEHKDAASSLPHSSFTGSFFRARLEFRTIWIV